jgi:hypothetical protein
VAAVDTTDTDSTYLPNQNNLIPCGILAAGDFSFTGHYQLNRSFNRQTDLHQ